MRLRLASRATPTFKIRAPEICWRAWARFLRDQGATIGEIGQMLGISPTSASRLLKG